MPRNIFRRKTTAQKKTVTASKRKKASPVTGSATAKPKPARPGTYKDVRERSIAKSTQDGTKRPRTKAAMLEHLGETKRSSFGVIRDRVTPLATKAGKKLPEFGSPRSAWIALEKELTDAVQQPH